MRHLIRVCRLLSADIAGSTASVTFDVPEAVPESDLEHAVGSPIDTWEVSTVFTFDETSCICWRGCARCAAP